MNQGEGSKNIFDNLASNLMLYIFFLPNLAILIYPAIPYCTQTWSVGVEEQFYLICPILMKKVKNKKLLLITILTSYIGIKICFRLIHKLGFWNQYLDTAQTFFQTFSIDCMAIGGLFALYLFNNDKYLKILFSKYLQIPTLVAIILLIANGIYIPYFHYEFYGILFGVLIVNFAGNEKSIINLEYEPFHYLGKISYGLYMYHPLAIVISIKSLLYFNITNIFIQYSISVFLTVLISGLSYKYFESYILNKKAKYSKILSGDKVN